MKAKARAGMGQVAPLPLRHGEARVATWEAQQTWKSLVSCTLGSGFCALEIKIRIVRNESYFGEF